MEASVPSEGERALERPTLTGGEAYSQDVAFSSGRSSEWTPQTVAEVQAALGPKAADIRTQAAALTPSQLGRSRRVVVEAEVFPNFLAATHYPSRLLGATGLIPVGSRPARGVRKTPRQGDIEDQPTKVFLLSGDSPALERLERLFTGQEPLTSPIAEDLIKFTDLRLAGPAQVLRMGTGEAPPERDGKLVFEAVLHPQLAAPAEPDPAAERRVREDFAAYVDELGGEISERYATREGGMWHMPVLLPAETFRRAAAFSQLRALRPIAAVRPIPEIGEVAYELLSLPEPHGGHRGRRIAVFDGGVECVVPGLDQWINEFDYTGQPHLDAHREHGTAVTSAALFGPLDQGADIVVPHAGVDHHRVWPLPPGIDVDGELVWVLEQIERAIATGQYRVAVITLAPALSVEDAEPHRWTAALDRMAVDHDVLFVVAAGNNGELAQGLDRILVPADVINGLSVGSCGGRTGLPVRDSYSCIGPGRPGGMTAPTGVQFGGNFDTEPFPALTAGGMVAGHEGTSLAAPVVARACAELDAGIGGGASANLLRAVAVHCAARPTARQAQVPGSTTRDVGYGRFPLSLLPEMDHRPNEVTIIYEGLVQRQQRIGLDIPIPDDVFLAAPNRRFRVTWTLSFMAPVEPANPVDYSAAGIQVVFRPHAFTFNLTREDTREAGSAVIADRATREQLKAIGWRISRFPASAPQTGVAPEVEQRQHHGKWESVMRMDRSFSGFKLCRPRLDLHGLVREGGDLIRDAEPIRYALIATVVAPSHVNVYDRTVAHATLLTPLPVTIPIPVPTS